MKSIILVLISLNVIFTEINTSHATTTSTKTLISAPQDQLPEGWCSSDISGAMKGGQKVISNKKIILYGAGIDIWDRRDQFRFLWKKVDGDFTLTAKIEQFKDTHQYAKAGLMFRNTLHPDSALCLINIFPNISIEIGSRLEKGQMMTAVKGDHLKLPVELKLERKGDELFVSYKRNDSWVRSNSYRLNGLKNIGFAGLVALSHDNKQLTKIDYSNISWEGKVMQPKEEDLAATQINMSSVGGETTDWKERIQYSRIVDFAGYKWSIKSANQKVGPGGNYFSDSEEHIWVDDKGFHFTIKSAENKSWCTEAILFEKSFGYGTYVFHTRTRFDLHPANIVAGFFTWDNYGDSGFERWPYREIDIEFCRWGNESDSSIGQFTIQPWDAQGVSKRFPAPLSDDDKDLTLIFEWKEEECNFAVYNGHMIPPDLNREKLVSEWTYRGQYLQPPGRENVRINLWNFQGITPGENSIIDMLVTNFVFIPPVIE